MVKTLNRAAAAKATTPGTFNLDPAEAAVEEVELAAPPLAVPVPEDPVPLVAVPVLEDPAPPVAVLLAVEPPDDVPLVEVPLRAAQLV